MTDYQEPVETVDELIEELEAIRAEHGGDTPVVNHYLHLNIKPRVFQGEVHL